MSSRRRFQFFVLAVSAVALALPPEATTQTPERGAAVRLEIGRGSKANYRIRERLVGINFPVDAVGETETVSGMLEIRPDGTFSPMSKLTVDLRTLKSDEARRDGYVRRNTLESERFPFAEFVPKRHTGMPIPLPIMGTGRFQLIGDMTLHGVTSQVTWEVAANFAQVLTARASTRFNFAKFNLTIPRVRSVLSVNDDIILELNVNLRRTAGQ